MNEPARKAIFLNRLSKNYLFSSANFFMNSTSAFTPSSVMAL